MRDGDIEDGYVWFSFNLQQLEWLQELVPAGDAFRRVVAEAIEKLEKQQGER